MRLNVKKIFFGGSVLVALWLFVIVFIPRVEEGSPTNQDPKDPMMFFDDRIKKIEQELRSQYSDISSLLVQLKKLKKTENEAKDNLENELEDGQALAEPPSVTVLPVLVIACNRVTVKRCLQNLVKFRPNKETFPIIVSQDCGHNETTQVIKSFVDADPSITLVLQPDQSEIKLPRQRVKHRGYYNIARHFKFALNYVFRTLSHEAVIIVEDDLDVSPDFFEYFQGTYPLLLKDPSIWCVSAWNDNGRKDLVDQSHPGLLHRTDFFPGLGWLLRKESWLELDPKWPAAYWDDWLRNPENVNNRSCIRPEISRTYTFGKVGVSKGYFFDQHLRYNELNQQFVEFTKLNLTYLLKWHYDPWLEGVVSAAREASAEEVAAGRAGAGGGGEGGAARVRYDSARSFQRAAKKLGLMDEFRSGIPRTAYRGVVQCYTRGRRVYLAPSFKWTRYDPQWG